MSFALSKLLWIFVSPGGLLTLALAVGLVFAFSARSFLQKTGRILCFIVLFCLVALSLLPVGDWALTPLENRFALQTPARVDGIIVLGGDEQPQISEARHQPTANESTRRYLMFNELAHTFPKAKLIYTGGSGRLFPKATLKEADVARELMAGMGVPIKRVLFETKSRNTYENAAYAATLARPESKQNWVLVTSAWHMPRAMASFRKAGWNVYAAPTAYRTTGDASWGSALRFEEQLHGLTMAMHEYIGLIAYRLMGRTDALWPG